MPVGALSKYITWAFKCHGYTLFVDLEYKNAKSSLTWCLY